MTLIAIVKFQEDYYMVGDLIASNEKVMEAENITFHILDNVKYNDPNRKASAYKQKIKIINNNLVLGFSGNSHSAARIMEYIEAINPKSKEDLFDFLNNHHIVDEIQKTPSLGVDMLGLMQSEGQIIPFVWNATSKQRYIEKGKNCVIGSGKEHFVSIYEKAKGYRLIDDPKSIDQVLAMIGSILSDSIHSSLNLQNHYGGFYEVVGRFEDKFKKFSDYSFIVQDILRCTQKKFECTHPRVIMKPLYYKDAFVVCRQLYNYTQAGKVDTNVWLTTPMNSEENEKYDYKFNVKDLNASNQIFLFNQKGSEPNSVRCFTIVGRQALIWNEGSGKLTITPKEPKSYDELMQSAKSIVLSY